MIKNGKLVAENADNASYRKQDVNRGDPAFVMSRSALCDFAECPIKWLLGTEEKATTATDWGSLFDCRVLDSQNFDKRYAIIPPTYPAGEKHEKVKAGLLQVGDPLPWHSTATYCKDWLAVNVQGRETCKAEDMEGCNMAIARLLEDPDISDILTNSRFQVMVTAEWHDPDTGLVIPVKTLMDIVPNDDCEAPEASESIIDLKSTRSAKPERWVRDVVAYGLHTQAAFYGTVWNSIPGVKPRKYFKHICIENEAPYIVEKQNLSTEFMEMGKKAYESALKRYCQCLTSNEWPGYRNRLTVNGWGQTEPTAWMLANEE